MAVVVLRMLVLAAVVAAVAVAVVVLHLLVQVVHNFDVASHTGSFCTQ